MPSENPQNILNSNEGGHMARIADAAYLVEQKMRTRGENPDEITFDSIYALAQAQNNADSRLTYPWMDKEWLTMTSNQKIKMLNELIGSWLDDEHIILYANQVANGCLSNFTEEERQQLVGGAEDRASEALDRMNADGYFNKDQE